LLRSSDVRRDFKPLVAADVMTAAEVAELLHVPKSTVEHWARTGQVPSRKIGRRRLFLRPASEEVLLGCRRQCVTLLRYLAD